MKKTLSLTALILSVAILFTACGAKNLNTVSWPNYPIANTGYSANFPAEPTIQKASLGVSYYKVESYGDGIILKIDLFIGIGVLNIAPEMTKTFLENYTTSYMTEDSSLIEDGMVDDFSYQTVYKNPDGSFTAARAYLVGADIECIYLQYIGEWNEANKAAAEKYLDSVRKNAPTA